MSLLPRPVRAGAGILALAAALAQPAAAQSTQLAQPFVIAPVVEGILLCANAAVEPALRGTFEAASHCGTRRYNAAAALRHALGLLEPGGAAGAVQVGYTVPVALLGLYRKNAAGQWVLDAQRIDRLLALIARVDRPVVVYLLADHFDAQGPLVDELLKNPDNLMRLPDGTAPVADYFGNRIVPYTLLADRDLPVNRYRLDAVRVLSQRLAALPPRVRSRIVAVTLAGELHHLFRDFESGMGEHTGLVTTDYSPRAVAGFRRWLQQRYGSIDALNRTHGFAFRDFDTVPAPGKDIRKQPLTSFAEHYDTFAGGTLPIGGWLWDPKRRVEALDLYVDGALVGPVPRGFNRLDVYRALDAVDDPNIGFRIDYPFHSLPAGPHNAEVVATVAGRRHLLQRVRFHVVPRDQSAVGTVPQPPQSTLSALADVPGVRSHLDLPRDGQDVYYNPLAREWNAWRDQQPGALLRAFFDTARQAGLTASVLYSHQIAPQVNSSWNPLLFAADSALDRAAPWRLGINLYGGGADSDWVSDWLARHGARGYGVPEFHPQQWKRPSVHRAALERHRRGGARFVGPYYLSITSPLRIDAAPALKALELRPDNPAEGSSQLYRAIRALAAE